MRCESTLRRSSSRCWPPPLPCTSGDDTSDQTTGTTSGTSTTEADAPAGPPGAGVTDEAISIGITYVDLAALRDVLNIDHGDYEAVYNALIDDVNARGGINGRRVEAMIAPVGPTNQASADAACVQLTEDEELFLVLGFFLADNVLCYVETHGMAVIGGSMTPERLARAQAPWFTIDPGSDAQADALRALAEAGELDGDLAVFAPIADEPLLRGTIEPLLAELGLEPVETAVIDAPPGDIAAANAQVGVIAERFRAAGATKVLIIGQGGTVWGTGMEGRSYQPQAIFLSYNEILAFVLDQAGRDLSFLAGAVSAGALSHQDAFQQDSMHEDCLDILAEAGVEVTDPAIDPDHNGMTSARVGCQAFTLFEALLTAAGDVPNYDTLAAAGEGLGDIEMPGELEPWHYGPPPSADGDQPQYLFDWDPAEATFVVREE